MPLSAPPSFLANLFTLGIARARWISATNQALGHSTGFLFAWLLQTFANFGLAGRFNDALRAAGSSHSVPQVVVFLFAPWPFFGAPAQFRRGVAALNASRAGTPAPMAA
jgi:hypothetical protein